MGDAESGPVRLSFNSQLRVEFRGATVTSDAGQLLPRELDERLGLNALIERHLTDPRTGRISQVPLASAIYYVGWPCPWPSRTGR
jgi:Transposase DDE domain group 1